MEDVWAIQFNRENIFIGTREKCDLWLEDVLGQLRYYDLLYRNGVDICETNFWNCFQIVKIQESEFNPFSNVSWDMFDDVF